MDALFIAALLSGLIGSLHCLGMCGPIVLMLPVGTISKTELLLGRLMYNFGRVITYAILGAFSGLLGHLIFLAGYQQALSIILGAIILLAFILPRRLIRRMSPSFVRNFTDRLQSLWAGLLNSSRLISLLFIGLLNGLLPCGLVYVALAAASTTGNALKGSLYMAIFGFGTVPLMLIFSLFSGLLPGGFRRLAFRLVPIGAIALGILLIIRGLSLGIPYISPRLHPQPAKMVQEQIIESPLKHDCCK
jgi:uncharacterized protein